jgi:hypothetical protein
MALLALAVVVAGCGSDDEDAAVPGLLTRSASCDEGAISRLPTPASYDGAVLVNIPLPGQSEEEADELLDLECRLAVAVNESGAGGYDGNVIGADEFVIYLYGPNAEALGDAVTDALEGEAVPVGSYLIVRQGEPGTPETRVELR